MDTSTTGTGSLKKLSPTYLIICLYYLLSGVEYAVILPTLNLYLLNLGAQSFFIGLVMSSFSLTGLLSAPIYGRVTDLTGSTKWAVVFSNVFEIGGNFMYFSAVNPYMILGSRLIAGVGSGSGSSIFGMISRSTTKEERTAAFSHLMALRQIGLIIGPAFNLFLQKLDFQIGPFPVNPFTAPGMFMALLWVIHTLLLLIFYKEFYSKTKRSNSQGDDECFENDVVERNSTNKNGISSEVPYTSEYEVREVRKSAVRRDRAPSQFFTYVYNDLLREEVIVCLSVTFTLMFVQTGIETLLTPLTLQLFDWGELPNSLFFLVAGVLIVISFVALAAISKKVSDRVLLTTGLWVMVGCYVIFTAYISFAVKSPVGSPWVVAVFSVQSCILVLDLPFVWVPQASLYSKITSERTQGFNQGIRLLVMGVGQILGPLWAASLLDRLEILGSVNLGMICLLLVMVLASYKRLDVPDERNLPAAESRDGENDSTERTPLLGNGSVGIQA